MSSELTDISLVDCLKDLKSRKISARELTEAYLGSIDSGDRLNLFITKTPEIALSMADEIDANIRNNNELRAIEGCCLGIKDLFCMKNVRTTAASRMLEDFKPFYESTVTDRLWKSGGIMLGKLNCDEFAMGSSNENSYFGPAVNPWRSKYSDKDLTPGGSSGGSAAAVAARFCLAAIGTDTGGSIRLPSSYSGVVGLKPTYGLCSRWGVIAFASSLDQPGPIARNVEDAAIVLGTMAGYDPKDSTSMDVKIENYRNHLNNDIKGLKVGLIKEYRDMSVPPDIEKIYQSSLDWLRNGW